MFPVEQPFKTYTGLDGAPLDNGYVYFGQPDQNPQTAPVTVYWDAAGTIPAAQPLRTVNGYIVRAGTPANVYYGGPYSVLVQDARYRQVFYGPNSIDFDIGFLLNGALQALQLVDYSALRAFTGLQKSVFVTGYLATSAPSGAAGAFVRDDHDVNSADDGVSIIVAANGVRWKRADPVITLAMFGARMDGSDDTAAWVAAAAWSNATKRTVEIPSGISVYAGGDFTGDFVSFRGAGMPSANFTLTALVGGTVVRGKMVFRGAVVRLADFGVDMGSAYHPGAASDALVISKAGGEWAHIENVIGMGRDPADTAHGVLIEGYAKLTGGNVIGVNNIYGVAIKARAANFGDMTGINNSQAAVILKHDDVYNGSGRSVYGNVLATGSGSTQYGLLVLCLNAGTGSVEMRDIIVGDVVYSGVQTGCSVQADKQSTGATLLDDISIGNISGSHTANAFLTQVQGGAQIFTVKHGDLIVSPSGTGAGVADYEAGFNIITGKTVANLSAASSRIDNAVYVGAAVYNYVSSGLALSVDYGASFAGVSFNGGFGFVSGIQNFESYGTAPIVRTGLNANGTPGAGRFVKGEFVRYNSPAKDGNNMTLTGWTRLTTGNTHVMGTDWAINYVSHVSPAA